MSTAEIAIPVPKERLRSFGPLATLARRRFQLTARTPRELFVPLLTPIMFALVIAPALKTALHTSASYESFVAIAATGGSSKSANTNTTSTTQSNQADTCPHHNGSNA